LTIVLGLHITGWPTKVITYRKQNGSD